MSVNYREILVRAAAKGMHRSGALAVMQAFSEHFEIVPSFPKASFGLRQVRNAKSVIICHHRVGRGGVPFYSNFDPRAFEDQIRFLKKAYRIVSMDDICQELNDDRRGQAVAITFDDGYRDLYTHAWPILRKYDVPATIYLTVSSIESGEAPWYDRIFALLMHYRKDTVDLEKILGAQFTLSSRESRLWAGIEIIRILRRYQNQKRLELCADLEQIADLPAGEMGGRMLTWEQIREMHRSGIAFGSHTMTHPVVGQLSASESERELGASKRLVEDRLQQPVTHFAYPFGSASDIGVETSSLLGKFGYKSAVSTIRGLNTAKTDRHMLHRIGGEEPSLSLFAAHLRWLFLAPASAEAHGAEKTDSGQVNQVNEVRV